MDQKNWDPNTPWAPKSDMEKTWETYFYPLKAKRLGAPTLPKPDV